MREAFAELPVAQCEVLVRKVVEQMTFREIAATARVSLAAIASRYRHAIDKLRRALEDKHNGW